MRLTAFSRFLIVLAIVLGVGYVAKQHVLPKFQKNGTTAEAKTLPTSESGTLPSAGGTTERGVENTPPPTSNSTPSTNASTVKFNYQPPAPNGGVLKGVVELGASGFNSFVVRIDQEKNWKLEKSEFGNSLVWENMTTPTDITTGLKRYIGGMLDFGVGPKNIHFVVSSGALKNDATQKIINALKSLNYYVNTVTPEQEGQLALKCVLPSDFENEAYVVDIGSGNTKISWKDNGTIKSLEGAGAKYFQNGLSDATIADQIKRLASQVPQGKRKTCFIIGGAPFDMAKTHRTGKERYTPLKNPQEYPASGEKMKAGLNIYKAIKDATNTQTFVFDWDSNFTIGYLLGMK